MNTPLDTLLVVSIVIFVSCERKFDDAVEIPNSSSPGKANKFERQFLEGKSFISRSGRKLGFDSDAELRFTKEKVVLIEYELEITKYEGSFRYDNQSGLVEVDFGDKSWPKMRLRMHDKKPFLYREDGNTYMDPDLKEDEFFQNFWPFALEN